MTLRLRPKPVAHPEPSTAPVHRAPRRRASGSVRRAGVLVPALSLVLAIVGQPAADAAAKHKKHRHAHSVTTAKVTTAKVTTAAVLPAHVKAISPTWATVWQDDFSGAAGTAPSSANWFHDTGYGWTAGEVQTYTSSTANSALDGSGHLRITPLRDAAGNWTSARLETVRSDFAPSSGGKLKMEASIALPGGGQGYWPAFWSMGNTLRTGAQQWPANGEVDMMENVDNRPQISGTLHCGTATGGPCDEPNGLYGVHQFSAAPSTAGFHDYSVIWDAGAKTLTYQFDGVTFNTVTAAQIGATTWQQAMSHGYFMLLNVAVGGGWPGAPDSTTVSGASMLVDYVKVSTSP